MGTGTASTRSQSPFSDRLERATIELDALDRSAAESFDGYIVRKDLVRKFARQYPVPTYVCEFLLGRYCASVVDEEIAEGLKIVEKQLKDRTVRTGDEELFKSRAKEQGSVRLIDIVRARVDAKNDCYVAELPSLALRDVRLAFFGVGATPVRARAAEAALARGEDAVAALAQDLDPQTDVQASAATRRHLAGVLLRRVAAQLAEPRP